MKKPKSILFRDILYKKHEFALVHRLKYCDICVRPARARYYARCHYGHWAYACTQHFITNNGQLGMGKGQILITYNELKELNSGLD